MRNVIRFAAAFLVGCVVAVVGVVIFEALDIGGLAWWGLVIVAMIAGSLVDRDRFYGSEFEFRRTRPNNH